MIRCITGATWRRYQIREAEIAQSTAELAQARQEASEAEVDVALIREDLFDLQAAHEETEAALAEARQERGTLRRALADVTAVLLAAEDAEAARRRAARLLMRYSESADLVLLAQEPQVHLYLHRGVVRSAHPTAEAARLAAEAEGAHPDGWFNAADDTEAREAAPPIFSLGSLPLEGAAWPDRSRVFLHLLDGRPLAAFGTEPAARAALCATCTASRVAPEVREMEVGAAAPSTVSF
ncbi:hypothetical protein GCM10023347_07650 [Streptomyces chumphonensis]|uniref:Uncharacterized protein n=1 Tax=Streptomyces chumphonensis TaxID=1214925 RepID=A0A927IFE3_9ACTN|nr:hypothetical protein [Streptomyces chumphonensis]MBD3934845.1 hypothetical protein [Streptomyces chumphonensis]